MSALTGVTLRCSLRGIRSWEVGAGVLIALA